MSSTQERKRVAYELHRFSFRVVTLDNTQVALAGIYRTSISLRLVLPVTLLTTHKGKRLFSSMSMDSILLLTHSHSYSHQT